VKILLLDIETSPNTAHVWGLWNVNVSINQILDSGRTLCWAAKWLGDKKIMFDSVHQSSSLEMVTRIHQLLDEADAVVHYNGQKFDIPSLQKEFLLHGLPPASPFKQIDLLRTARRQFRFPSNKLDYIAQTLGLGSKVRHKGHDLWIACMNGEPKSWKVMERYNKQDVILLEKVYHKLLPWIPNHPNVSLYNEAETPCCTNCGSSNLQRRGLSHTKVSTYQRFQCSDCGGWNKARVAEKTSRQHLLVRDNG
jgi:DNA polymerase elongation subunit (family B)